MKLRSTPDEEALVRRAAEKTGETVEEYVRRQTLRAAAEDLDDDNYVDPCPQAFVLDGPAWDALQARLAEPPRHNPAIAKLLARPYVAQQRP